MITNIRLDLTDAQRQAIASYISGKPVKRLATRAEVNQLVQDLLATTMSGSPAPKTKADRRRAERDEVNESLHRQIAGDHCSDDCCTRNHLLQSRVNVLQHRLDTRR